MENKENIQQPTTANAKKKWYALYIVAGLIIIGGIVGLIINNQQDIAACKNICDYNPITQAWRYPSHTIGYASKDLQTQEQCVNYCLAKFGY